MSAPNESKISTTCAACAKPTAASCSRCRLAHYCGPECQLAQWPAHKEPCRRAGALRALPAVPADLPVKVAALAARGLTAVFVGPKGRGLRALKPIPCGTVFAYVAGPCYKTDADINAMSEFEYFFAGIVGDVATGTPCLPDAVNGSLVNDPMTAETYGLLTQGDLSRALAAYFRQDIRYRNAEALEPTVGNATEIYTIRDVAAGEELLVSYGLYYWVQMLAGKRLAGTTFHAAWAANMFLLKGDTKCFAALLEITKLANAPWEQQAAFLGKRFGMSGGSVPLWLKWEGVRLAFAGVAGDSYHGYCHSGGVNVYVRASWDRHEAKAPGTGLAVRAVVLLARGLLPLAASLSDRHHACEVVRKLLLELPRSNPKLAKMLPEAIVFHGQADTVLDALDAMESAPDAKESAPDGGLLDALDAMESAPDAKESAPDGGGK